MKKQRKIILPVMAAVILFAAAVFCLPAAATGSSCYVRTDETVEITGNAEYSSLTVYGTFVIKTGAVVTVEDINLFNGGKIEIEDGATLILSGGTFFHRGNLIMNGTFKGSSDYFSCNAPVTIGQNGLLSVTVDDANTASSAASSLRTCGASNATNYDATIWASAAAHVHTYDANGICTGCGASGCLFGTYPHTYKYGVCTGCGKNEIVSITGKKDYYNLSVKENTIIKAGAQVTLNTLDVAKGVKLTVEKGAVLTLRRGDINARGDLIIDGMLIGDIDYFSVSGSFKLGNDGYMVLNVTQSRNIDSITRQLKMSGVTSSVFVNTIIGGKENHAHTYNEKGACTVCGLIGCKIGEYKHIYQNGVCTGCGVIDPNHTHTYNENGACTLCGTIGCKIGELAHTYRDYVCTTCGAVDSHHSHRYIAGVCTICGYKCIHDFSDFGPDNDENICNICRISKCELNGGHSYKNGKCTVCGTVCENDFHKASYACPECNMRIYHSVTGSVLSEGSLTVVVGVAGLAAGFLVAMLIFRKKKAAVISMSAEDEE